MWHIVSWWYSHVSNTVKLWQRTKKQCPEHKAMSKKMTLSSYVKVKGNRSQRSDTKTCPPKNKFDHELKFNDGSGSWMYSKYRLMVIHPCAIYGMPMSQQIKNKLQPETDLHRQMDRQTDRLTDGDSYTYLLNFVRVSK